MRIDVVLPRDLYGGFTDDDDDDRRRRKRPRRRRLRVKPQRPKARR
jgi:hypothetical protein